MRDTIYLPLTEIEVRGKRAGEQVLLTGEILLARDAAHKLLYEMIINGEKLPVNLENAVIYYCGPTPTPPGRVIGSAGPTTSSRMDAYTPLLLRHGVRATIGKGERSKAVIEAMREYGALYFAVLGGAGALLSLCFESSEIAAFPELGTEALRIARVRDFPALIAVDSYGDSFKIEDGFSFHLNIANNESNA